MLKVRTLFCLYNEGFFLAQTPVQTYFGRTTTGQKHLVCLKVEGEPPFWGRFLPTSLAFLDGQFSLNENQRVQAHPGAKATPLDSGLFAKLGESKPERLGRRRGKLGDAGCVPLKPEVVREGVP